MKYITILTIFLLFLNNTLKAQYCEGEIVGNCITVGNENGYAAGYYTLTSRYRTNEFIERGYAEKEDVFIAQFDWNGDLIWRKDFGGLKTDRANSIDHDTTGVVVTGQIHGDVYFDNLTVNARGYDAFIVKYDPAGNLLWVRQVGSTNKAAARGSEVRIGANGAVYATGYYQYNAVFSDSLVLLGNRYNAGYIAKYSTTGQPTMAISLAGGHSVRIEAMDLDANDNIFIAGYFQKTVEFKDQNGAVAKTLTASNPDIEEEIFIAKFTSNGEFVAAQKAIGLGEDWARSLAVDLEGNVILAGDFREEITFSDESSSHYFESRGDRDGFVAKYDNNLRILWVKHIGKDPARLMNNGLTTDQDNNILVVGHFYREFSIDSTTHPNHNKSRPDIYRLKLAPDGSTLSVSTEGGTDRDFCRAIADDKNGHTAYIGTIFGPALIGGENISPVGNGDLFIARLGPNNSVPQKNAQYKTAARLADNEPKVQGKVLNRIYPIPTKQDLFLDLACQNTEQLLLAIYTIQGKPILTERLVCQGQFTHQLQLRRSMPSGVYFLKIWGEGEAPEVYKIIFE